MLNPYIYIAKSRDDIPSKEVSNNESESLLVVPDHSKNNTCLFFSSRLAMYDFARSLLHESIYGSGGQKEFYPLEDDGKMLVVDGVRMEKASARLFVFYK